MPIADDYTFYCDLFSRETRNIANIMETLTVIVLTVIAVALFTAARKGWISNHALETMANVAGIVSMLAAILVFVVPTPDDPVATQIPPDIVTPSDQDVLINMDEILSEIVHGNGGIEKAAPWWKAIADAKVNATYDPTAHPGKEGCFGVAWNVLGLDHTVVAFQSAQTLDFQAGGQYSLICLIDDVKLSAYDVGRIQAEWLSKEHGGNWEVKVLE